jgi:exopolysaccharide production protein ExoY
VTPTQGAAQRPKSGDVSAPAVELDRRGRERGRSAGLVRIALVEGDDGAAIDPPTGLQGIWAAAKRATDVVMALVLLVLLSPLLLIVAAAVKIESQGPVFFSHRRLGKDGSTFLCLKFRSMHVDAEDLLHRDEALRHHYVSNHFKIPASLDPRVTRFGRLLRRSSLDELPQLFNVLRGDMSLVGPRPIVPLEATHYGDELDTLLAVRPGLTGAWAVKGRSAVGYPDRVGIELEYVRSWSFRNDLDILRRTPAAVLSQRGAV